jgi:quercetin dioxygenase-like cupin family protein
MSATATRTDQLWFMNGLVNIPVSHEDGEDGISFIEHLAPHGDSPPLHLHQREDELVHVLEGELRVRIGDDELRVGVGRTILAPRRVPHTYRVESDTARWLVITTHGEFERFVRSFSRPAERNELPEPSGPPTPEQQEALAAVCRENGIELVGPPLE